jgi:hypothetical protein
MSGLAGDHDIVHARSGVVQLVAVLLVLDQRTHQPGPNFQINEIHTPPSTGVRPSGIRPINISVLLLRTILQERDREGPHHTTYAPTPSYSHRSPTPHTARGAPPRGRRTQSGMEAAGGARPCPAARSACVRRRA